MAGPNTIPDEWRSSLNEAVRRPAAQLTEDQLDDTLFWLAREVCAALSPQAWGLQLAGMAISSDDVDVIRATFFEAHLVGLVEIAEELYKRHPDRRAVAADWRDSLRQDLEQSAPPPLSGE